MFVNWVKTKINTAKKFYNYIMAEVTHSVVFSSDGHGRNSRIPSLWKSCLYQLQQEAPIPKQILCNREVYGKPSHFGREFHGKISWEEAERLLVEDGCYLVRENQRALGQYTLSMKFGGITKNFKLYYDGKHYVGEKRFDTIQDLVADGLFAMYLEVHGSDNIATMCMESKYEDIKHPKDEVALKKDISTKFESFHEYDRPPVEPSTNDVFLHEDGDDLDVLQFEKPDVYKWLEKQSEPVQWELSSKRKAPFQQQPQAKKKKVYGEMDFMAEAIEELQDISKLAAEIPKEENFDLFGKFAALLLRTIGAPRALEIQETMTTLLFKELNGKPSA